ncbi:ABC transporter permease subunit [Jeotgalibacillus aurantiacus]|uniref:ABC transporter permease subunit n=1 Tax=Jeotgalibacillus aurantiacus TaxID=2763266 RepID=UPI001D0B252D|nr:ABC transporter permease subunit [Jeotgalibacillus aurantiacus]
MNAYPVLLKKEWLEMKRSYKWLWMPLVFIALGIMQPLTSYYLPDILEQFGGLPEGAVIEIPLPGAGQVFVETLGQFSQIGLFVVVLGIMGMLSGERTGGTAVMVLAKPVSYFAYFFSKWTAAAAIVLISYVAGAAASLYYIYLLFDPISFADVMSASFFYILWLLFAVSLVLSLSTVLKRSAAVAGAGLVILLLLSLLSSIFREPMLWTPGSLTLHSQAIMMNESPEGAWRSIISTILLSVLLVAGSIRYLKKKEWVQ